MVCVRLVADMTHIFRFKTFDEERSLTFVQMYEKGFDPRSFEGSPGDSIFSVRIYYAPGLYKFRSFEEARKDDLERMIKHAYLKAVNKGVRSS